MVSYASMKLKVDTSTKKIDLDNGTSIEVLKYLPIEEKYNLIEITLQKAYEGGIYNPLKLDMYFALNLVYLYSNISFTDKQREDENKIYDTLQSNGILDKIIDAIDDEEYNNIYTLLVETEDKYTEYNRSLVGIVDKLSTTVGQDADELNNIISNFKPEQFKNVMEFAQAANGNRPIGQIE